MKLKAPFDCLEIDLDAQEQSIVQDCIQKQVDFDNQGKNASQKLNETKICGANWKQLWKEGIIKYGDEDI